MDANVATTTSERRRASQLCVRLTPTAPELWSFGAVLDPLVPAASQLRVRLIAIATVNVSEPLLLPTAAALWRTGLVFSRSSEGLI
jgi:hypothetical protein